MSNKILFKGKRPSASPFIASLDTATNYDAGTNVTLDSNGFAYVVGRISAGTGSTTTANGVLAKYSLNGTLVWQKNIASTTAVLDSSDACATDSAGNIYVVGKGGGTSSTAYSYIIKFNSAGTIVWQRKFDAVTNDADYSTKIVINTTGDILISIHVEGTVQYDYLFKYNSAGTLIKQFKLFQSGTSITITALTCDSAGDFYIAYTSGVNCTVFKYSNSSNLILWSMYTGNANGFTITGMVCSSDSVYILCKSTTFTMIAKLDIVTGSLVWKYNTNFVPIEISVDSYGNLYCCGSTFISKILPTGAVSWVNALSSSTLVGICSDGSSNIYITGSLNSGTAAVMVTACLPANGTIPLTGTYTLGSVSTTYSVSSGTTSGNTDTFNTGSNATFAELNPNYWARTYETTGPSGRRLYDMTLTSTGVAITGKMYVGTVSYIFDTLITSAGVVSDRVYYVGTRTDSQGNGITASGATRVVAGRAGGTGSTDQAVFLSSNGSSKSLGGTSGRDEAHDVIVKSNGDYWGIGSTYTTGSVDTLFLLNMTSALGISSATYFDTVDVANATLARDSGDSPIALLTYTPTGSGTQSYLLVKFNTSGAIVWQLELLSGITPSTKITTYGTDIYIGLNGVTKSGVTGTFGVLVKINSAGTVVAAKYMQPSSGNSAINGIVINPSNGNIVVGMNSGRLVILDSSFAIINSIYLSGYIDHFVCSGTDIYAAGEITVSGTYQFGIIKFPQQSLISGVFTDSTSSFTVTVEGSLSANITLSDADVSTKIYAATKLTTGTTPTPTWGNTTMTQTTTAATSKTIQFGVADAAGTLTSANAGLTVARQLLV